MSSSSSASSGKNDKETQNVSENVRENVGITMKLYSEQRRYQSSKNPAKNKPDSP
jgi:hypothetical protein